MDSRPSKRPKLDADREIGHDDPASIRSKRAAFLNSISRSISPPGISRSASSTPQPPSRDTTRQTSTVVKVKNASSPASKATVSPHQSLKKTESKVSRPAQSTSPVPSPFKLTSIRDLPPSKNVDAVSLHDILGNPLIREAWIFNYCFDVDWLMTHFDLDIRSLVKVKVVHGSWKNEDLNKIGIDDACRRWANAESVTAYLPDAFGTHHSKMFVLFLHDDQAQVIIHTANMLQKDWTNMTQAVWQSPMLSPIKDGANPATPVGKIGSGSRFKHDLMAYFSAYGSRTKALREQLDLFDFGGVRGALVASVPAHMENFSTSQNSATLAKQKLCGYPSLFRALQSIRPPQTSSSHVVCQISSIATLPVTWLNQFFPVLCGETSTPKFQTDRVSIIYPTPVNVASSLDGYASGGSIHTKAQSPAHLKQIATLRKSLCQWTSGSRAKRSASREEAAPHIKTYVCFAGKPTDQNPAPDIQWALLTSANLSVQAWGTLRQKGKGKDKDKDKDTEVVVQSFEIGVLVWPELFAEDFDTGEDGEATAASIAGKPPTTRMVPVFGRDTPTSPNNTDDTTDVAKPVVGLRLPYDLPLTPYREDDMPWSPQGEYKVPDRHGRRWPRDFF